MATEARHPHAQAADLICATQKDAIYQADLQHTLSDLARRLRGSRWAQIHQREIQSLSLLLYLSSTTLLANRTLGEEYCDIVPVEASSHRFPALGHRAGYVFSSGVLPYLLSILVPRLSARAKSSFSPTVGAGGQTPAKSKLAAAGFDMLQRLADLASPAQLHALYIAVFYLQGSYYQLSKQLFQTRYIYLRSSDSTDERGGYEALGLLLLLQVIVQAVSRFSGGIHTSMSTSDTHQPLLAQYSPLQASRSTTLESKTHTWIASTEENRLDRPEAMAWIQGEQRRKCVLCLENLKCPSVTACGHTFCWTCVLAWIREKPECPLCRQHVTAQHVLPIRC